MVFTAKIIVAQCMAVNRRLCADMYFCGQNHIIYFISRRYVSLHKENVIVAIISK